MQARNPNLRQKKFLASKRLKPENWLVISDDRCQMVILSRVTGKQKALAKD